MPIPGELRRVLEERGTLSVETAEQLMDRLLRGDASEVETAALVGGLAARGETADEIAGFALALRRAAITLPLTASERDALVDTCGTGGDGANTFNISTAAALVAAAAGVQVAKHGNRAVTSRCGSADVLQALGVPVDLPPEAAADCLREHGFCFLLAPAHHPGLRAVMPVRRALGVRTVFNLLGPLLNPAGARRQVMGVYSAAVLPAVGGAMQRLGVQHALVVHGDGGLDELSLSGRSEAVRVTANAQGNEVLALEITPEQAGLGRSPVGALAGAQNAQGNAEILRAIFGREPGPRRDAVLLNAAAVLLVADRVTDLASGARLAAETVDSGAVLELISRLQRVTTRAAIP